MPKVIICGTHPDQFNGYSKVMFEISSYLGGCPDIDLHIFGFQNFYEGALHKRERSIQNVSVYDVYANEIPKNKGFGENLIVDYINKIDPDIVIIYNDLIILQTLISKINTIPNKRFKIVPYIDIVYNNERNDMVVNLNNSCDGGILFTKHWESVIKAQGFTKPTYVVEHGFNPNVFFKIPKKLCRDYFQIKQDDFIIMNLNRNQPRKRWDICLMAFVKFISTRLGSDIKLLIAAPLKGSWDLVDIMISESRKYNIRFDDLRNHLIIIQNPQQLTDYDINILYNVADLGFNTCDGEGFGLCNFEQAGLGVPQVVPHIGGFLDFFDKSNSIIIKPKYSFYRDHSTDVVSGEAEVCDVDDYVSALAFYYDDRPMIGIHGQRIRDKIISNYMWSSKGSKLYSVIIETTRDIEKVKEDKFDEDKLKQDKLDEDKLKQDKLKQDKLKQDKLKQDKLDEDKLKQDKLKQDKLDEDKLKQDKLDEDKLKEDKLKQDKLDEDKLDEDKLKQDKLKQDKLKQDKLDEDKEIKEMQSKVNELQKLQVRVDELKEFQLKRKQLKETQLKETQLKEMQLKETQLKETQLKDMQLKETQLKETQLKEMQLKDMQLKEMRLKDMQLKEMRLKETQLKEMRLKETQLKETQLKETQLKETQLKEMRLKEKNKSHTESTGELQITHGNFNPDEDIDNMSIEEMKKMIRQFIGGDN
jgi:hypothetical protein